MTSGREVKQRGRCLLYTSLAPLRHAHLIRDPRELLASYAKVRSAPEFDDLGLRQQVEIFDALGGPVIDSRDLLERPEGCLLYTSRCV